MTPLSFFSVIKIGLALALGALISWSVQSVRYDTLRRDYAAYRANAQQAQLDAVQAARLAEKKNTQRLQEALDGAERREAKNLADAAAARRAAGSLREQLAAIKSGLPGVSADACRVRASAVSDVLGDSVEAYRDLAEQADRLVSDLRTLSDGWPK